MSFPAQDGEFWIVTGIAACAAAWLLRSIIPERLRPWKRKGKPAQLTVKGRSPDRKR